VEARPNEQLLHLLDPYNYAGIRNGMLLLALEKQLKVAIFLDDDEIIEDRTFFSRCMQGLGETAPDGGQIDGKGGPYMEESPPAESMHEPSCWPKIRVMRQALEQLSEPVPRFKATLLALGGNMVMRRRVMQAIPFDPSIHRGEDMDYVFNARLRGFRFYFDPLFQAEWLTQRLEEETGVERFEFPQQLMHFSPPMKAMGRLIATKKLRHNVHPIFTWQLSHVKAYTDANGNERPVRQKKGDHRTIDGVVAAIMAIRDAIAHDDNGATCYDDDDQELEFI